MIPKVIWLFICVCLGAKRPNVLIFMADDLGTGDVGFLGNDTIGTDNLDRLAKNGIILNQHLAPASVCTPSRSGLGNDKIRPVKVCLTLKGKHKNSGLMFDSLGRHF